MMHGHEKSDSAIVATKPPNKASVRGAPSNGPPYRNRCARIADSTVGDIHITDPASYQAHLPRALATIARFGGRVVAGGGKIDFLEGDPMPERIFIIEFSTAGAARRWNQSDDYQEALKTRLSGSHGRVFLIEGNEISGAVPVAGSRLFSFCP